MTGNHETCKTGNGGEMETDRGEHYEGTRSIRPQENQGNRKPEESTENNHKTYFIREGTGRRVRGNRSITITMRSKDTTLIYGD